MYDALACHVTPPSKLYAASASPDPGSTLLSPLSFAPFTVNVTFWFVHLSGFPVTFVIVGAVWSNWLKVIAVDFKLFVPSVILATTVVSLLTVIDLLYILNVFPPSVLTSFLPIICPYTFFISGYVKVIVFSKLQSFGENLYPISLIGFNFTVIVFSSHFPFLVHALTFITYSFNLPFSSAFRFSYKWDALLLEITFPSSTDSNIHLLLHLFLHPLALLSLLYYLL